MNKNQCISLFLSVFFIVLICKEGMAQQNCKYSIATDHFVSRTGIYGGIKGGLTFADWVFDIGTGYNWQNLVQFTYYSPYISGGVGYQLVGTEKISVSLGLNYQLHWNRYLYNTKPKIHALYYQYKLKIGKNKLFFLQETGVGAMIRTSFPESNHLVWDIKLAIGIGYAF